MKEVRKYPNCFICGDQNQRGVQAKFYFDGEKAMTRVKATPAFEGYQGIYHGGVIASLLDEVMIKAILANEVYAVTAELTVRFVSPVRVGDEIELTGWVTGSKGRVYFAEGQAIGEKGKVFATASAKYIRAGDELKSELMKSIVEKE